MISILNYKESDTTCQEIFSKKEKYFFHLFAFRIRKTGKLSSISGKVFNLFIIFVQNALKFTKKFYQKKMDFFSGICYNKKVNPAGVLPPMGNI